MQIAASHETTAQPSRPLAEQGDGTDAAADPRLAQYKIIRRNGAVVGFEPRKITIALTKAFLAVSGGQGAASARIRDVTGQLTDTVVAALMRRKPEGGAIHIEEIQDQVELALMRAGDIVEQLGEDQLAALITVSDPSQLDVVCERMRTTLGARRPTRTTPRGRRTCPARGTRTSASSSTRR